MPAGASDRGYPHRNRPVGRHSCRADKGSGDAVFVLACDMPYPEPPLYIEYMMQRLRNSAAAGENRNACLTERGGFLETMHAFYCRSALLILGQELARGNYSVQRFARIINSLIIAEAEARPLVPGWRAFTNLNTPEDYRRFRAGAAAMQIIKEYEIVRIQTDLARSLRDLVIVEFALRLKVNGRNHTNFFCAHPTTSKSWSAAIFFF